MREYQRRLSVFEAIPGTGSIVSTKCTPVVNFVFSVECHCVPSPTSDIQ